MEVILAAVGILLYIVVGERKKYRKALKKRHERCRRLTYYSNPAAQKGGVISFSELAERYALLHLGCTDDRN